MTSRTEDPAALPPRTLAMLDARSGRDFALTSVREDGAGGVVVRPPAGFVVVRPATIGRWHLILGFLDLREEGWRYAPNHAGGRPSRRAHPTPAGACKGRGPGGDDLVLTRMEAREAGLLRSGEGR